MVTLTEFSKRKAVQWDGEGPAYSYLSDEFYRDWDAVFYFLSEDCEIDDPTQADLERLMLAPCEPVFARYIEDDYWEDQLPDSGGPMVEVDPVLSALIDAVNRYIRLATPILSWKPGDATRVDCSEVLLPRF